jgi:hypothetical protein
VFYRSIFALPPVLLAVVLIMLNSAHAAGPISDECPTYAKEGAEGCPPAEWVLCPDVPGLKHQYMSFEAFDSGENSGPNWDRSEFNALGDKFWLTCSYVDTSKPGARADDVVKRVVLEINGSLVQFGKQGGKSGLRIAGLIGPPRVAEAIALTKTATLRGIQLGWNEDELRAFAAREGYAMQKGDFTDYLLENWGMPAMRNADRWHNYETYLIRFAAYAGPRVTLRRGDQSIDVIFHPETKVVREVTIHVEGADAVRKMRQEILFRYSPAKAHLGAARIGELDAFWFDKESFVVAEFFHHRSTGEGDPEGGFARLADQDF